MKIGLDAKWYFEGPPSGRLVVVNQTRAFAELDSGHDLYLFLDARARNRALPFDGTVHRVYLWGDNNLVANLWHLPRAADRLGLDVVICQNFAPTVGRFARVAFVYDVIFESHPEYYTWVERLYFRPAKFLARRADRVCAISASERDRMVRYGYARPGKIDVVPLGVDSRFKPAELHSPDTLAEVVRRYHLPPRFLLFVGRLNVRKNLLNLLRAIPLMRDRTIPLLMVGQRDWKMFDIDALIENLGIKARSILKGPVPGDALAAIYAVATVFCFPSYEEGFGLPALEAMASGVPVVVSDRSSLPEICADAGTYANPDDPASIARAIDALLDDPVLAASKRTAGLERARRFTWDASARALLASAVRAAEDRASGGR